MKTHEVPGLADRVVYLCIHLGISLKFKSLLPFGIGDVYIHEMSESELLREFRESRSEPAFTELVRRYAGLVYSVAKRRVANAEQAEDVTQLVFIRLAKTPPKVQNPAELAAWLHRTAVNVSIDMWRSDSRRQHREQQAIVMEPTTISPATWEEIAPNLDEALNQLGEDDRQAILLRYFAEKAMRDVGLALGVSEDAAKMRVSRALDRLKTQLATKGVACTAVALGAVLTERAVEAVPSAMLSNLTKIKLPVVAGAVGLLGILNTIWQIPKFHLAVGVVVLGFLGASVVQFVRSTRAPVLDPVALLSQTNEAQTTATTTENSKRRSSGFIALPMATSVTPAQKITKILFHVLDSETGAGLASAKVHAAFFGPGGAGESHDLATDGNGDAPIPEPDDTEKRSGPNVFVTIEGYVPKVVNFSQLGGAPSEYTMKLDPAMTVSGWVVDEEGKPVSGVNVLIEGPGNIQGQTENIDFQTCPVTSRDDGTWTCSYIPKDWTNEIRFALKKPGFATTLPIVPVAKVTLNNIVLVLDRGFTITGHVADEQQKAIPNAEIKVLANRNNRQSTKTEPNGAYTFTGVVGEADTYQEQPLSTNDNGSAIIRGMVGEGPVHTELVIQADGYAPQTRTVSLSSVTNEVNFVLTPARKLFGQVVDQAGKPVANAVVQTDWDNRGLRVYEWHTRTDVQGQFEWNSAPDGPVLFWIEAPGYQVQRDIPLEAKMTGHIITVRR